MWEYDNFFGYLILLASIGVLGALIGLACGLGIIIRGRHQGQERFQSLIGATRLGFYIGGGLGVLGLSIRILDNGWWWLTDVFSGTTGMDSGITQLVILAVVILLGWLGYKLYEKIGVWWWWRNKVAINAMYVPEKLRDVLRVDTLVDGECASYSLLGKEKLLPEDADEIVKRILSAKFDFLLGNVGIQLEGKSYMVIRKIGSEIIINTSSTHEPEGRFDVSTTFITTPMKIYNDFRNDRAAAQKKYSNSPFAVIALSDQIRRLPNGRICIELGVATPAKSNDELSYIQIVSAECDESGIILEQLLSYGPQTVPQKREVVARQLMAQWS